MGTPELFDEMGQLNKKDIQVIIADDNMSATLFLSEPAKEEDPYTYEEVMRALSNAGVKMGLDDARIHHMVEEQIYNTAVVVAQGKMVQDGADGYYEFEFETDLKAKPSVPSSLHRKNGYVQFHLFPETPYTAPDGSVYRRMAYTFLPHGFLQDP